MMNTFFIYTKAVFSIVITLYTTRVLMLVLGVEDFGLFNVIGGVIGLLSFLNAAMTTSTQRYISVSLGSGNIEKTREVFVNSIFLHILIGIILVILFETAGSYLLNNKLQIDPQRINAANILFQFVIISTFFTILSVPFDAVINARENMLFVAIISLTEVILKLLIALSLQFIAQDKLIYYSILLAIVTILITLVKATYTTRKYDEAKASLKKYYNLRSMKEQASFASWNTFGALSGVARNQGISVILNMFLGTVINAAYSVAYQLAGQFTFFSATMMQVTNPQIMKSEGAGDRKKMLFLSMSASKFCFFLMCFISIPFLFEADTILKLWLKVVPEYTESFCILVLISILINQLTIGLQSAIQATGKVKVYQLIVGSLTLFNLPIAYVILRLGYSPDFVLMSFIFIEILACGFRVILLNKLAELSIKDFLNRVLFKEILPIVASSLTCWVITQTFDFRYRFILTFAISIPVFFIFVYFVGLCKDERDTIQGILFKIKNRFLK
ncbi:MATE family efflux transporter [Dysgonomonas sp. 520]|uniref:MATE family efflux transporter n=1 Tax=Dysgonomonas sp. 520 TaxID=2302931 RepID=UPI002102DA79|nr:MATE family efflux transporter [Dysgonomonas sp. 520]